MKEKRVKCARWNSLRQRMKGTSTQTKLDLLAVYLRNAWMHFTNQFPAEERMLLINAHWARLHQL